MRRPLQFCRVILPLNFVCSHQESSLLFLLLFKMLLLCFTEKFSGCLCCKPFCAFAKSPAHQCQFATTCKLQQLPVCNKPSIKFCVDTYFSFFKEFQLCLQSFHNHRMTLPFPSFSKYLNHSEVVKEFSTALT